MSKECLSLKSIIKVTITDVKTKKVLDVKYFHNIITNNGLKWIRNQLANVLYSTDPVFNIETRLSYIALGSSNTPVGASQTSLGNELIRKELYPNPDVNCETILVDNDKVTYTIYLSEPELAGETIREIGLFAKSDSTFMVSRALTGNLEKSGDIEFTIEYTWIVSDN